MKRILTLILAGTFSLWALAESDATSPSSDSVLINGSFEDGEEGWHLWGGEIVTDVTKEGGSALRVQNDNHKWSGADQIIALPRGTRKVTFSGWMKTESVDMGLNPWEMARLSVEFLDKNKSMVGDYLPVTGETKKKRDWKHYENTYRPVLGSKYFKVIVALANARGEAFFDGLEVKFLDKNGEPIVP